MAAAYRPKRDRGPDGDLRSQFVRHDGRRLEPCNRSVGALACEVSAFLDSVALGADGTARDESSPSPRAEVLREALLVVSNALLFHGSPGDCYESVRCFRSATVQLLQLFGRYQLSSCGAYLTLSSHEALSTVAALQCALRTLHDCTGMTPTLFTLSSSSSSVSAPHRHLSRLTAVICNCRGFGWTHGVDYVPAVARALRSDLGCGCDAFLVVNAVLTDAGSVNLARVSRMKFASAHHRYGIGLMVMSQRHEVMECGTFSSAACVAVATLVSRCGPLLVLTQLMPCGGTAADDAAEVQQLLRWLDRVVEGPLPCVVVWTGCTGRIDGEPAVGGLRPLSSSMNFTDSGGAGDGDGVQEQLWVRGALAETVCRSYILIPPPTAEGPGCGTAAAGFASRAFASSPFHALGTQGQDLQEQSGDGDDETPRSRSALECKHVLCQFPVSDSLAAM